MGLKSWWQERKVRRDKDKFRAGFDWAAGAMLRRELGPSEVYSYVEEATDCGEQTMFDDGALAAVDAWRARERMLT